MKKHEDPFVGHVLEVDCKEPLKRMRMGNKTQKQLRDDCDVGPTNYIDNMIQWWTLEQNGQ